MHKNIFSTRATKCKTLNYHLKINSVTIAIQMSVYEYYIGCFSV